MAKSKKTQRALEIAKAQELAKGVKPKFVKPGITGENLTGVRRWSR